MEFRCVECGSPIKTLYTQYSPGNIGLMKCVNCKAIADEYIECELMIIVIDVILHKSKAYRHLFYNMFNRDALNIEGVLWKSALAYFLFDTYQIMVSMRCQKNWSSTTNSAILSWSNGKMLMILFFGNFMFTCMLFLGTKKLLKTSIGVFRCTKKGQIGAQSSYYARSSERDRSTLRLLYATFPCIFVRGCFCDSNP